MRPSCKKNPALAAIIVMLLLLCNTLVVFATNSDPDSVEPSLEVSTFEEFMSLLEEEQLFSDGKMIHVTNDLVVPPDGEIYTIWPPNSTDTPIVVDMEEHTLYVEGCLRVRKSASGAGITFTGQGGEKGLVRIKAGGEAHLSHANLLAAQDGYALWQEEGSLLQYESAADASGLVHFAERPVAVPFSFISPQVGLPVAVVHDGQMPEDVLPKEDSVRLYWQGVMDQGSDDEDKLIPVIWDLEQYQDELEARQRVVITGSYPEATAFQVPKCLVVFQDSRPAVFLDCYGTESFNRLAASVNVELADPELGCRFEWSQDNETWLPADARQIPHWKGILNFSITFPQDISPTYPYYLSAVVDYPDGSTGYSDVIVIREASAQSDSGGNRGGGTDITNPPKPEPIPSPNPEETNGSNTIPSGDEEELIEPEPTPDAKEEEPAGTEPTSDAKEKESTEQEPTSGAKEKESTEPDTTSDTKDEKTVRSGTVSGSVPKITSESGITSDSKQEESSESDTLSEPAPESQSRQDILSAEAITQETPQPKQDGKAAGLSKQTISSEKDPLTKVIPIAAGCLAIIVLIGVAGIYHRR